MSPTRSEIWITGAAAVTGLGPSLQATWRAMLAGRTAGRWVQLRTPSGQTVRVPAAPVESRLMADLPLERSALRADRMALAMARQAVRSAALHGTALRDAAIIFSTSKPPVDEWFAPMIARQCRAAPGDGLARPAQAKLGATPEQREWPLSYRTISFEQLAPNRPAARILAAMRLRGPVLSSIAACSTGLHAVLRAVQWLQDGTGHVVIAGAAESSLNPLFAGAFLRMGVLAADRRLVAHACRPFDRDRSGFIIGEGAAALVMETAEHARRRGGRPLAIIRGYALGADPAGLTEPDPCGAPLAGVIRRCLRSAGSAPECVACIKAHGTGTRQNDPAETAAIHAAFGVPGPPTVSFKGHIGHALGASGAIEAAILTKAIAADIIPPTANLRHPDPACGLNHPTAPATIFRPGAEQILCLSAGLGGHLGAMLLGSPFSAT